jgi:AcrR family transcriptional regulator
MDEDHRTSRSPRRTRAEAVEGERGPNNTLTPATARGEATRRRILDAAEAVIGEKGYHAASVTEITQRAQVAQGTFYLYFHSKREIFLQLVEDLGEQLRAASREATRDIPGRMEKERKGFAAFFEFARGHRQLYRIVQEADRVDLRTFQEYYTRIARGYTRGLRAAMEAGEIRQMDPETLAYALVGIGHFLALRWLIWPQGDEAAEATSAQNGVKPGQPADIAKEAAPELPERVFETLMEFLAHGLLP